SGSESSLILRLFGVKVCTSFSFLPTTKACNQTVALSTYLVDWGVLGTYTKRRAQLDWASNEHSSPLCCAARSPSCSIPPCGAAEPPSHGLYAPGGVPSTHGEIEARQLKANLPPPLEIVKERCPR
ncbi:hypothetical protein THAOC_10462, partial [Thalassiosira oceanica]